MTTLFPPTDWAALIDRYFDAQTSEAEELLLRRFVASPLADAPEMASLRTAIDEVRAVMGVPVAARRHQGRKALFAPRSKPQRQWRGVAAALIGVVLLAGGGAVYQYRNPSCLAYVDGERITDPAAVQLRMEETLRQALQPTADQVTMEAQLGEMFSMLSSTTSTDE